MAEPSGRFMTRVPTSLHADLSAAAEKEGVSLNAFVNSALAAAVGWRSPDAPKKLPGTLARYLDDRGSWIVNIDGKVDVQTLERGDRAGAWGVYILIDGYYESEGDAERSLEREAPRFAEAVEADGVASYQRDRAGKARR